jgi:glycosyltransferase involved in cell wall biosynthesis
VERLSRRKGVKVNLIQDYETWTGHVESVHRSYDLKDVHNIVISQGLYDIVRQFTAKPLLILSNAIDTDKFRLENPVENRDPASVCMMYHLQERKGVRYGLEALDMVAKRIPDLKVILFSVFDNPGNWPEYVSFHQKPADLCSLYNRSAIYVTNSLQEGWALPPAEAMQCGCALICTDIPGHQGYASDETALRVPPRQPQLMAEAIISLINRPERRIQLAKAGNRFVKRFSWEQSATVLERFLNDRLTP